jgi:uncharacterized MnhB-related membrane protein
MPSGVFWVIASIIILLIGAAILFIAYKFLYGFITPAIFGGKCASAIAQYRFNTFLFPAVALYNAIFGGQINYNTQASNLQAACLVTGKLAALTPFSFASELYSYASACYGLFNQQNSALTNSLLTQQSLHNEFECFIGSISGNNSINIGQLEYLLQKYFFNPHSPLKIVILTNYTDSNGNTYGVYPSQSFIIRPNASISITYIYYDSKHLSCIPANYGGNLYSLANAPSGCKSSICSSSYYYTSILGLEVGQPNVSAVCPGSSQGVNPYQTLSILSSKCITNLSLDVNSIIPHINEPNSPFAGCVANYTYPATKITGYSFRTRGSTTTTVLEGNEYNISVPFCGNIPVSAIGGESRVIVCIT